MKQIQVVSWDVYGTLIATYYDELSDCGDLPIVPRTGALESLSLIKSKGINQCTCSDGDIGNLRRNMQEAKIDRNFFDDLYKMTPHQPKDFSYIIQSYNIKPENLLVIGDNYKIDITLAKKQGCQTLWVPEPIKYNNNPLSIEKIISILEN
jgi:FMN phosphatase YigB (HAD superfamily)